jgi:hypothetical protein
MGTCMGVALAMHHERSSDEARCLFVRLLGARGLDTQSRWGASDILIQRPHLVIPEARSGQKQAGVRDTKYETYRGTPTGYGAAPCHASSTRSGHMAFGCHATGRCSWLLRNLLMAPPEADGADGTTYCYLDSWFLRQTASPESNMSESSRLFLSAACTSFRATKGG